MRYSVYSIWENKGADQLRGNRAANKCLCFCYISTSKMRNFKPLTIFSDCTVRYLSDLVGNPEDRFSGDAAHMSLKNFFVMWIMLIFIASVLLDCEGSLSILKVPKMETILCLQMKKTTT